MSLYIPKDNIEYLMNTNTLISYTYLYFYRYAKSVTLPRIMYMFVFGRTHTTNIFWQRLRPIAYIYRK